MKSDKNHAKNADCCGKCNGESEADKLSNNHEHKHGKDHQHKAQGSCHDKKHNHENDSCCSGHDAAEASGCCNGSGDSDAGDGGCCSGSAEKNDGKCCNGSEAENAEDLVNINDVPTLQSLLSDAIAKADEFRNRYLMARAEADNIQKRTVRDIENAHKYALDRFVPDLLAIKDSLELGAKAAKEAEATEQTDITTFIQGSEMTINMFNDALSKQGVLAVNPNIGDDFNHDHHQAITTLESDTIEPNKVIEVVQKGYFLNGRLIRPALVVVAKAKVATI